MIDCFEKTAVVPKSEAKLSVDEMKKELVAKLAKYKIPERWFIVKSIPKYVRVD